jgi:membrane associated rhomboid family serine protease
MPSTDLRAAISSAPMSAVLIAVNLTVFVAVSIESRLLDILALPSDWAGVAEQPWTLLTVFFTAEVLIHIAVAVLVIGLFGPKFERVAGSVHVLAVYLLAGLAGSLAIIATAALTGIGEPSVGASAAFLGLLGALAASPRGAWGAKLAVGKWVIVVLVIQLVAPVLSEAVGVGAGIGDWTSSAAHLVGLAVGAGYGYLLRAKTPSELPGGSIPAR